MNLTFVSNSHYFLHKKDRKYKNMQISHSQKLLIYEQKNIINCYGKGCKYMRSSHV